MSSFFIFWMGTFVACFTYLCYLGYLIEGKRLTLRVLVGSLIMSCMPPVVNIAWVFAATSEVVMETNVLDEQLKAIAKFFDKTIYENKE